MPFLYGCVTIQKYANEIIEFIENKVLMMKFHFKTTEMIQF